MERAESLLFTPDRQGISWGPWNLGSRPSSTTVTAKSLALWPLSRWVPVFWGEVIRNGLSNSSLLVPQHQRVQELSSESREWAQDTSAEHYGADSAVCPQGDGTTLGCFPADISGHSQPSQVLWFQSDSLHSSQQSPQGSRIKPGHRTAFSLRAELITKISSSYPAFLCCISFHTDRQQVMLHSLFCTPSTQEM